MEAAVSSFELLSNMAPFSGLQKQRHYFPTSIPQNLSLNNLRPLPLHYKSLQFGRTPRPRANVVRSRRQLGDPKLWQTLPEAVPTNGLRELRFARCLNPYDLSIRSDPEVKTTASFTFNRFVALIRNVTMLLLGYRWCLLSCHLSFSVRLRR